MHQTHSRGRILEVFLFAIGSVLLYRFGLGELLFLIPIQMAGVRRGWRSLFLTAGLTLLFFTGYSLFLYLSAAERSATTAMELLIHPLAPVAAFIAGILIVNLPALSGSRLLFRLLAATLAIGAIAAPALILLPRLPSFTAAENAIVAAISDSARSLIGESSPLTPEVLKSYIPILIGVSLPGYFLFLSLGCWGGVAAGRKTLPLIGGDTPSITRLSAFHAPGWLLWPSIAAVGAFGADILFNLSSHGLAPLSAAISNLAVIALVLYGLQGLAIMKFVFEKYRLPGILWALLLFIVVLLLGYPPTNIIMVFGLPAFGVSETWIRYRIPVEPATDDD